MSAVPLTVAADGLSKAFKGPGGGRVPALDAVSLQVRAGELTALVGPDGAGKTTLMRMVAGLLRPDSGQLTVLGQDVVPDPQPVQDRISYMPQRFGLYEDLSVQENLDLYADLHGVPAAVRAARYASLLQMTDLAAFTTRPAGKLSGGMKQKLGLACTLVRRPELLLLDEPTVGVDPLSRRELWQILQQLLAQEPGGGAPRLTVLLSTAYMDEAERCAQVLVMSRGRLLTQGAPALLRQRAAGLTFLAAAPPGMPARLLQARLLDATDAVIDAVPRGGQVYFIRKAGADAARLQGLLQDATCAARPAELEDAVMMLLQAQGREPAAAAPGESGQTQPVGAPAVEPADAASAARAAPVEPTGPAHSQGRTAAIQVEHLVRRFGAFTAVDDVSFAVGHGEIFGLLGPNGAGKTTTFRMLCGLLPASSGTLTVAGVNLRTAPARARARIGYVSQKFALYRNLTVLENMTVFGGAYGLAGERLRRRIAATLAQYDLPPHARSGELPGGYQQRLAMAVSLLHEPDILFLDEPTSGIDPLARRAFWRTITGLAGHGVTIIITTHFMEEAEYCDRIAILDAGVLLALGTPAQVRGAAGAADMNGAFIGVVERARQQRTVHGGAA